MEGSGGSGGQGKGRERGGGACHGSRTSKTFASGDTSIDSGSFFFLSLVRETQHILSVGATSDGNFLSHWVGPPTSGRTAAATTEGEEEEEGVIGHCLYGHACRYSLLDSSSKKRNIIPLHNQCATNQLPGQVLFVSFPSFAPARSTRGGRGGEREEDEKPDCAALRALVRHASARFSLFSGRFHHFSCFKKDPGAGGLRPPRDGDRISCFSSQDKNPMIRTAFLGSLTLSSTTNNHTPPPPPPPLRGEMSGENKKESGVFSSFSDGCWPPARWDLG